MMNDFLKKMFGACLLMILVQVTVFGQESNLVGRVSDVKGELMVGVTVQEKGTTNACITDVNGQ